MRKLVEFFLPAALACIAAFVVTTAGCNGEDDPCVEDPSLAECSTGGSEKCADGPDECTDCTRRADCEDARASSDNRNFLCNVAVGECVHVCRSNAECTGDQVCEELRCRTPACVSDADCGNEHCISGECQAPIAPTAVASCSVQPANALLNTGDAYEFTVLAKNADGTTVPFKGTTSWTVTNGTAAGDTFRTTVTAAAAGEVKVEAKVGSVDCAPAAGTAYAAVESGSRVVVADLISGKPVKGAVVVVDGEEVTTGDDGAAALTATGTKTVSVFSSAHSFVTVANTESDDLIVYVKPNIEKVGFKGTKTAADFARLEVLNETVRLALMGSSIPGNLIDINIDTLIGELVDTQLDLGSINQEVPLPSGTVMGLGQQMFKQDYEILATPGVRTIWALGGNASFAELTGAIAGALGGDDIDVGGVLATLLPMLGKLQSGAVTGVQTPEPIDGETALEDLEVPLDMLLRLNVNAKVPDLTPYTVNGAELSNEAAIVLAGALYSPQGLVPLGLSAGIDEDKNGKVDNAIDASKEGVVPLRFAARHAGLETGEFVTLALATSVSGLLGDITGEDGEDLPLVLSGLVNFLPNFKFAATPEAAEEIELASRWLNPSERVTVDDDARTVTLDAVDGASFYRLDIGSAGREWSVYFGQPAGAEATVTIPAVPEQFASDDRFDEDAGIVLQAVSTGYGEDLTFDKVVSFSSTNMNDLTRQIDAFVMREVR